MTPQAEPDAFSRLAPFLQQALYQQGWTELRPLQLDAISALMDGTGHLLISSGTASGKTEAAFLPILTHLFQSGPSASVLYIAPLKALINDQSVRLKRLTTGSTLRLTAWHGDADPAAKKRLLASPGGVLQITPEALEGLLLRRTLHLQDLFGGLTHVVIDEAHAFMQSERGRQVQCLLERLERFTPAPPRRVGLSATLGNLDDAAEWLRGSSGTPVTVIRDSGQGRQLRLALEHYRTADTVGETSAAVEEDAPSAYTLAPGLNQAIYQHTLGLKSLVFRNSRQGAEDSGQALRELAALRGTPDIYHVHHGSVAARTREDAERALRHANEAACTVATVTLELGIDLGELDLVEQVGRPPSVASLVQRLGRSGRRGTPATMIFSSLESQEDPQRPVHQSLPWDLLLSISMLHLYLEDKWVETPLTPRYPCSLLVHQTLAALETHGQLSPPDLAGAVLTLTPLRHFSAAQYRTLLQGMLASGLISRNVDGTLRPGKVGERIVANYEFLSVFAQAKEYTVVCGARTVGTVGSNPGVGQLFSLAGRAWRVRSADAQRRRLTVTRERGRRASAWNGGSADLDTRVVRRARQLLGETDVPAYLQPAATRRLHEARDRVRESGLLGGTVHALSERHLLLTPWVGHRTLRTLQALLTLGGGTEGDPAQNAAAEHAVGIDEASFTLNLPGSLDSLKRRLARIPDQDTARAALKAEFLVRPALGEGRSVGGGKYDEHVPHDLLGDAYVHDVLDLPGAYTELNAWKLP